MGLLEADCTFHRLYDQTLSKLVHCMFVCVRVCVSVYLSLFLAYFPRVPWSKKPAVRLEHYSTLCGSASG